MFLYELRYLIMRVMRLLVTLSAEIVGLVTAVLGACWGVWGFLFFVVKPIDGIGFLLLSALCIGIAAIAMSIMIAAGSPYRFNTKTPGIRLATCKHCGKRIPDFAHCQECGQSRYAEHDGLAIIRCASWMVTVVWVTHDVLMFMFAFAKKS